MSLAMLPRLSRLAPTLMLASSLLALAPAAQAEDQPMTGDQIRATLTDKWMRSTDGEPSSMQLFLANGVTHYAQSGTTSKGRWEVRGDQYCSTWPPSTAWDCYDMVQNGQEYIFISKAGRRFPVRLDK